MSRICTMNAKMNRAATAIAVSLLWSSAAMAEDAVLSGAVTHPLTLDAATLQTLPATTITVTFQSGSGEESGTYTGVLVWDLLQKAGMVNAPGKNMALRHTLTVTGRDGYAAAIAEGEFDPLYGNKQVLLAYRAADRKASFDHLRLLVPGDLHGGRFVSDVVSIDVK
jgi:hypothetical protein